MRIIFRGGQVDAVPQHGAVLEGDVQGDDGNVQCGGFGGQNVGCRIGENADHIRITSVGVYSRQTKQRFYKKVEKSIPELPLKSQSLEVKNFDRTRNSRVLGCAGRLDVVQWPHILSKRKPEQEGKP